MKLTSSNPIIKEGVEYPYFAVTFAMSPIYKPGIGATVAIKLTPFRELDNKTYDILEEEVKCISLLDIFEIAQGDAHFEDAIQGIMQTLQTLINNKEL